MEAAGRVKRSSMVFLLLGAGLLAFLLARQDVARIGAVIASARWGLLIVVALHLPQTLFSALGWRALLPARSPGLGDLFLLRWVRDSINSLLPVAQVGGDVVRVRLLTRAGGPSLATAAGGVVVDISIETAAQILFTLVAVIMLVAEPRDASVRALAWGTGAACIGLGLAIGGVQRLGLLRLVERLASGGRAWRFLGDLSGLHAAAATLYAQPRRLWTSGIAHALAWGFGAIETYAALRAIGAPAGLAEAVVIEALGHMARAAGFLIPGGLGVQEGGYVLICRLYGIEPVDALSLSFIKRLRELALGLPGLLAWAWLERRWSRVGAVAAPPG